MPVFTFCTTLPRSNNRTRFIGEFLLSVTTVRLTVNDSGYLERSFATSTSEAGLLLFLSWPSSSLPDGDCKIISTTKNKKKLNKNQSKFI